MEQTLVLVFEKSNGGTHTLRYPHPKQGVTNTEVQALADYILNNQVIELSDMSQLQRLKTAGVQQVTQEVLIQA